MWLLQISSLSFDLHPFPIFNSLLLPGEPPFFLQSDHVYPTIPLCLLSHLLNLSHNLYLRSASLSHFTFTLIIPPLLLFNSLSWIWFCFTVLASMVTPGYILPYEDLQLGASNERDFYLSVSVLAVRLLPFLVLSIFLAEIMVSCFLYKRIPLCMCAILSLSICPLKDCQVVSFS